MHSRFAQRATIALLLVAGAVAGTTAGAQAQAQAQANTGKNAAPVAKRLCKPRLEATGGGTSRGEAQRKAIEGWAAAAAAAHGDAFTRWAIAGIARTSCSLTPEGHRCRAAASPCRDLNIEPAGKR